MFRTIIGTMIAVLGAASISLAAAGGPEKPAAGIIVNHVGFTPDSAKFFLLAGNEATTFEALDADGKAVFTGEARPGAGDLGSYRVGEFSALNRPGTYRIRAAGQSSGPFAISPTVYEDAITKTIAYFSIQRCGDSTTGYHHPCHLDDGRRLDNQQHQDVTGGWHDACDLRKWVNATLFGMRGLSKVAEVRGLDLPRITDEMRWGNLYFLKMQEPAGYVMDYCGGNDGNRWTDNQIGDQDDRPIHTEPARADVQFHFIIAQAAMYRLTREADPAYAAKCQEAAARCLKYALDRSIASDTLANATAAIACCELHRTMAMEKAEALAVGFADALLAAQVKQDPDAQTAIRGSFQRSARRAEPYAQLPDGNVPLIALCQLLETFPNHPSAAKWKEALRLHCDYLLRMSERNPFGLIPYSLYKDKDPGGDRRLGSCWYRYFAALPKDSRGREGWWVGINAHVASNGVGLARAGRLLGDARLGQLAQRQLDWIVGVNSFDASTMEDVGRNQPRQFVTGEFRPQTPHIPGAVMNGIGGHEDDSPWLRAGSWQTCEYWTPMVGYTMWLMAELQKGR
jgi:hypothetical protein